MSERYLLAKYIVKPKDPSRTKEKGYMSDEANIRYDEIIEFTRKLKQKHILENDIVLNLDTQMLVKTRYGEIDPEYSLRVYNYFITNYLEQISEYLARTPAPVVESN